MKAEDKLHSWLMNNCYDFPFPKNWHRSRDRWRTEALKAGYEDDLLTAEEKFDEYWNIRHLRPDSDKRTDSKYIAEALNIHDDLPDGELLDCPVCEQNMELEASFKVTDSVRSDKTRAGWTIACSCNSCLFFSVHSKLSQQQAINAANAAIHELTNN